MDMVMGVDPLEGDFRGAAPSHRAAAGIIANNSRLVISVIPSIEQHIRSRFSL